MAIEKIKIGSTEHELIASGLTNESAEKVKLNGIAEGAEVNQNAFSNVVVGSTTIVADSKTDTLTIVAGSNVTITPDATNDKITIAATDTKYSHPTSAGNKHIPAGGSSGQILRWSADGTAAWGADNDTKYSNFVKSGSGAAAGLVPAPSTTAGTTKYLREDGTWAVPPDNDTKYSHPTSSGNKHIPSGGASGQVLKWSADGTAAWGTDNDTKYSAGTGISFNGTTINNSGVRSVATGSANGTISVNTNGTAADVAVKGLGSAAYTASTAYATSGHTHSDYAKTADLDSVAFDGYVTKGAEAGSTIGEKATVEGDHNIASSNQAHAEGGYTRAGNLTIYSEFNGSYDSYGYEHAEGYSTLAKGNSAHAEGGYTQAISSMAHAEGISTVASGTASHAEGQETTASGYNAHAEGYQTTSSGENTHAEGNGTTASLQAAHAEGYKTTASGYAAHAEGYNTKASSSYQHVQGKNNIEDTSSAYAHIVGNGSSTSARANAHTLDWDGNAWFAGDVYVGSTSGTNKDSGSKKLLKEGDVTLSSLGAAASSHGTHVSYGTSATAVGSTASAGSATTVSRSDHTHSISAATTSTAGSMSAPDKAKLNYTNIAYGTCSTAAATAAKVITVSGNTNWTLTAGSIITVKFSETNTASNPTFNVNNTGAKSVGYGNGATITTSSLTMAGYKDRPMMYMYDGSKFVFISWSYDANTNTNVAFGQGYGTCSTAAATTAKVVTLSNYALVVGGIVAVKFTYAVPANATMNINSKGAKNIFHRCAKITANVIQAGDTATFIYDGTQYHLISIDKTYSLFSSDTSPTATGVINWTYG